MEIRCRKWCRHDDLAFDAALAVRPQGQYRARACSGSRPKSKSRAADTNDPADTVRRQNPLGKIPVLVIEDGTSLYDSRVILEYLDHRAGGGKIVPREPGARFAALRLQALADGMTDAQILVLYEERWRAPEHQVAKWVDYQADKIKRGLAALEADPPSLGAMPNVGRYRAGVFPRPSRPALSRAPGAATIPSSPHGLRSFPRKCRRSPKRKSRRRFRN